MSINIRFPSITGKTEVEQLTQVKSYLHQMVEQLNWAFSTIETKSTTETAEATTKQTKETGASYGDAVSFYELKSLIIKSADVMNAYYDKINAKLEGMYVAESDFGIYAEQTSQSISANTKSIEQFYRDMQQIIDDVDGVVHSQIEVNAHINTGLLYYADDGTPVYGLEIGQRTEIDGDEVFNKYARFTADKLSFYDQNGNEVAYISDRKLYIDRIEVTGSYSQGGFEDKALPDGSIVTRWMRGED